MSAPYYSDECDFPCCAPRPEMPGPHWDGSWLPPVDQANGQANTCRHDSASGIDTNFGPDKVWRCDHCGLQWTEGER